jgi:hypothetical protein
MSWSTSDRRSRLPVDWAQRVSATRRRAHDQCEAVTHQPGCNGVGAQCDHIDRGDDHTLTNLQWLSEACHAAKTQAEAREAQGMTRAARLPDERHPGALG